MKRKLKGAAKSRTAWFGLAVTVTGLLQDAVPYLQDTVPKELYGTSLIAIGAAILVLRWYTDSALEEKS